MSYRILKDDPKYFKVMHPDGTTFEVPKKGLSAAHMEKISKMPKMYDGGVVNFEENSSKIPTNDNEFGINQQNSKVDFMPMPSATPSPHPVPPAQQVAAPVETQVAQTTTELPIPKQNENSIGLAQQAPSPNNYAAYNMINKAGKEYATEAQKLADEQKAHAEKFKIFIDENRKKGEEIASRAIDSGRLFNNASTGNKMLAALSVVLGGIGSGLTGKSNFALDSINKAIDQDIEAQKEQKNSLYKQNLDAFKDQEMAYNATRLAQLDQLSAKAAKMSTTITSAQALDSANKFQQQIDMEKGKLTEAMSKRIQEKFNENYIPEIKAMSVIKPTDKDRSVISTAGGIKNDLQDLIKLAGTTIPGSEADAVIKNKIAGIQLKMKDAFQLGVLSQSDLDMLDKLVANPGAFRTEKAVKQLESSIQTMDGIQKNIFNKLGVVPNVPQNFKEFNITSGKLPLNKEK